MERTGTEVMNGRQQMTCMDAALDELLRIADNHATAMSLARRYGNTYGDEDRVRATRGMMEKVIRRLLPTLK